jgi:hypothetical protein
MNEISVLTFLAGVFCKIYDDLNDNNLFHSFHLEKNKEYINEFLKTIHTILITYVSSFHIYILLLCLLINAFFFIIDSKAYESPYEYSSIIAFSLFTLYLIIDKFTKMKILFKHFIFLATICLFGGYICDILLFNKVEFGYKKLVARALYTIIIILILVINYCFTLFPDELLIFSWYVIGYCVTSCMFQVYLIHQDTKPKLRKCKKLVKDKHAKNIQTPSSK